ncbi:hypothetical protein DFR86_01995 [Acidianus sulfidivorans JP7]|uniref:Uncharacterized protein n=1 Tax=Acidianus sulfidivorans JP7 TaxID=619593 RepID=A0A2U9IK65_9CREN|nr:hypothetical protein [Acidianus sulfidivorans]AWR96439.1 hypothetical protein DFR86_01995 [Acidianus sulfidivorans JP7]
MVNIVENEGDFKNFIQENLGKERIEVIVSSSVLEASPEIANKYSYSIIDGEDLPNGYFKLTLEYRKEKSK